MRTRLYHPPKLYDAWGDLSKRWFVYFHFWDDEKQKMQRHRLYADINRYTSKRERTKAARLLATGIVNLLRSGWSPHEETPDFVPQMTVNPPAKPPSPAAHHIEQPLRNSVAAAFE